MKKIFQRSKSVAVKLKAIPIHKREEEMKRRKDLAKECIRTNGDYFE